MLPFSFTITSSSQSLEYPLLECSLSPIVTSTISTGYRLRLIPQSPVVARPGDRLPTHPSVVITRLAVAYLRRCE